MNRLALTLVVALLAGLHTMSAQPAAQAEKQLAAAQHKATVEGDLKGAIEMYRKIAASAGANRALAVQALLAMAECHEKLGQRDATAVYERIVREFNDQGESVALARTRLSALQGGVRPTGGPTVRQAWSGAGVDPMGTPSADGRYLSFTDWETGDLAVRDLVANTSRRLTNTGGWEASADFAEFSVMSPDGRQVAYAWFIDKGPTKTARCLCRYEIRVLDLGAGDAKPQVLLQSEENFWLRPAAFTPDGKQLVVVRTMPDRTYQLGVVTLADASFRVLAPLGWKNPFGISMSPDGRSIVYDMPESADTGSHDIVLRSLDGAREAVIVRSPAHDQTPVWSTDGRHVLFISDRTGTDALWRLPMQGDKPSGPPVQALTAVSGISGLLGAARNGAVYYWAAGQNTNLYMADLDANVSAKSAPKIAVERFLNSNSAPSWSPDGTRVAYLSKRGSNPQVGFALMIRTMATGEDREVPVKVSIADRVSWFPDGRSVLAASRVMSEQNLAFYRIDLETGAAQLVLKTNSFGIPIRRPQVSPDGRSLVFIDTAVAPGMPSRRLVRYDLASGQETVLSRVGRNDSAFTSFAISPDGLEVAYLRSDQQADASILEVMPQSGGPSRELFREKNLGRSRFSGLAWTRDKRFILVTRTPDSSPTAASALWKVPVAGGAAEMTGISLPGLIQLPSLDATGERVMFTGEGGGAGPAIWVVENFLPRPPR